MAGLSSAVLGGTTTMQYRITSQAKHLSSSDHNVRRPASKSSDNTARIYIMQLVTANYMHLCGQTQTKKREQELNGQAIDAAVNLLQRQIQSYKYKYFK